MYLNLIILFIKHNECKQEYDYISCKCEVFSLILNDSFDQIALKSSVPYITTLPWRRPHCRQELATLPFVGANPKSPPFPYIHFAVFCVLLCVF